MEMKKQNGRRRRGERGGTGDKKEQHYDVCLFVVYSNAALYSQ